MIKLQKLRIEEFRGIRELEIEMDGKSLVIVGPNGSGKSGVVDAIDFVLTGSVARLSGAGTGGVSVTKHAPHVHKRDDPASAIVILEFTHVASGPVGVLTRSVKTAGQFNLEPNTTELAAAVAWAAEHSELTHSRREIIKYVNAEPGRRAQEVQALLKLDRVDETRRLLQSARTKMSGFAKTAEAGVKAAEEGIKRVLDLSNLLASEVLAVVNKQRIVLGLTELTAIEAETDFSAGAKTDGARQSFNKAVAIRDVEAVINYLSDHPGLDESVSELSAALAQLEADPTVLAAIRHRQLIEVGLPLVSEPACPLCDAVWKDVDALREHLNAKLTRSEAAARLQQRIQGAASRVAAQLRSLRGQIQAAQPHAVTMGRTDVQSALLDWYTDIAAFETKLAELASTRSAAARLKSDSLATPPTMVTDLNALREAIDALPDQSETDEARSYLSVAHDRWWQLRQARVMAAKADVAQKAADAVYETYNSIADAALTKLYKTVEDDFSNYYRQINADDEASFKAGLEPSAGKLDLEVDFYGIGMLPPMAYHSEGHQDGMGVCLYLALIGQLLQSDFRFAVLHDVVTSVDVNHRRQFCKLLVDLFPDVQFIVTTHDEVWARQMVSSGLVTRGSLTSFRGWTVDGGPLYGQGGDIWGKIDADLAKDDVPAAAHKLRRNLEASLGDIAANIQGSVVYRGDNHYELSAFFSAVKGRHGDLLKKAAVSANSWSNDAARV
ncbi:MAG: AAA family ATPase [Actinobacteria bacterium]|nr:AAA family ATPase [Actinomycetota bacterium]